MRLGYDGDLGLGGCNRLYGIGALEMLRFCSSDLIIVCGFGVCFRLDGRCEVVTEREKDLELPFKFDLVFLFSDLMPVIIPKRQVPSQVATVE